MKDTAGEATFQGRQVGTHDLALYGFAQAMSHLLSPREAPPLDDLALQLARRIAAATPTGLDMRRVQMPLRLASLQALVLALRTFRGRLALGEVAVAPSDLAWLQSAEQSLEDQIRGETFLATSFDGTFPRWSDIAAHEPRREPDRALLAAGRRRSELVAVMDLVLALAPKEPPPVLLGHLLGLDETACPSWFDAFAMFVVWQLHSRPQMWGLLTGGEPRAETVHDAAGSALIMRLLQGAQATSASFAPYVAAAPALSEEPAVWDTAPVVPRPAASPDLSAAIAALAAATGCPLVALAAVARRFESSMLPRPAVLAVLRQDAATLARLVSGLRGSGHQSLARAGDALAEARWSDAENALRDALALPAPDPEVIALAESTRAALRRMGGNALAAAQYVSRVLEQPIALTERQQIEIQLQAAVALCQEALIKDDERFRSLAERTAARVLEAGRSVLPPAAVAEAARCLAAAAFAALPPQQKPAQQRLAEALAKARDAVIGSDDEQAEVATLQAASHMALAELDADRKAEHLTAAERAARLAIAAVTEETPALLAAEATEVLGLCLVGLADAGGSDLQLEEATAALESVMLYGVADVDRARTGNLLQTLGMAHVRLAKQQVTKARLEVGAIALSRALAYVDAPAQRIKVAHALYDALARQAAGRLAERRVRQAIATLDVAEANCPPDAPSDERGLTCMSRCIARTRLRALRHEDAILTLAIADADRAAAEYRAIKGPYRVFLALRAKATALIEAGKETRSAELLAEGEQVYATLTADPQGYRIAHRDLCIALVTQAEAAAAVAEIEQDTAEDTAPAAAARERALASYRKALALAMTHNFPVLRANVQTAMTKLMAATDPSRAVEDDQQPA